MPVAAALLSSARTTWCTPDEVLDRVWIFDAIGLDPSSGEGSRVGARVAFTERGLDASWAGHGLVYCNPPYGRAIGEWTAKMREEAARGVELIALVPARTDTKWFQRDLAGADAFCFWSGRLTFRGAEHGAPFPSVLVYFGDRARRFARVFRNCGWIVMPSRLPTRK